MSFEASSPEEADAKVRLIRHAASIRKNYSFSIKKTNERINGVCARDQMKQFEKDESGNLLPLIWFGSHLTLVAIDKSSYFFFKSLLSFLRKKFWSAVRHITKRF